MESRLFPLQGSFARQFAQEWTEAWNSHDLELILSHYDEDVRLVSPVALQLSKNGDGVLQGKSALREYFRRGLQAFPTLHFDLIEVFWGVETIVLCYANQVRGDKTAEVMQLTPAGKVNRVWANYDQ
jgi:predicted ester cyclase